LNQHDILIEGGIDDLTIKNKFHMDPKSRQNESFANLKSEKTIQAQIVGNVKQEKAPIEKDVGGKLRIELRKLLASANFQ
jgi:hypothetical protein